MRANGTATHAIVPPLSFRGPALTIRRFSRVPTWPCRSSARLRCPFQHLMKPTQETRAIEDAIGSAIAPTAE
jgi:hypothetical protein